MGRGRPSEAIASIPEKERGPSRLGSLIPERQSGSPYTGMLKMVLLILMESFLLTLNINSTTRWKMG